MIWLHVGLHKTGTTSIQGALRLITHRARLAIWTIGDTPQASTRQWGEWAVRHAAHGDVILSDETLLGDPTRGYPDLPIRLAHLREVLPMQDVTVIVSLRRQDAWVQSVYLQSLQQGETWTPEEFWGQLRSSPFLRWTHLVSELESVLEPAGVRTLIHDSGRDAVADFLALCGQKPPPTAGTTLRDNVSISAAQAPVVRILNESRNQEEVHHLRSFMQLSAGSPQRHRLSAFPEGVQEQIAAEYRSDWEAVTTRDPSVEWPAEPAPFAGHDLASPYVAEEALRLLSIAIDQAGIPRRPSVLARAVTKIRTNPRDVPTAMVRAVRRRP